MKIFISWSGDRSRHVASALRDWLPEVIQAVKPWMSEEDIPAGAAWLARLRQTLNEGSSFGIICLTRECTATPWMMFEAGALAKSVEDARVCPYLIDMDPSDIPGGPLTIFQAKRADRDGTLALLNSINADLDPGNRLPNERLARAFETNWHTLDGRLRQIPQPTAGAPVATRPQGEKIDEILQLVRQLAGHDALVRALRAQYRPGTGVGRPQPSLDALQGLLNVGQNLRSEREDD